MQLNNPVTVAWLIRQAGRVSRTPVFSVDIFMGVLLFFLAGCPSRFELAEEQIVLHRSFSSVSWQ